MCRHPGAERMIMLPSALALLVVILAVTVLLPAIAVLAAPAMAVIAVGVLRGGHHERWLRRRARMPAMAPVPLRLLLSRVEASR